MKRLLFLSGLLLCSALFLLSGGQQQVRAAVAGLVQREVEVPAGYTTQLDAVYAKVGAWDGRMDLYLNSASVQPVPVIINIHGGGWNHGTKESQAGFSSFFKQGWSVANVEYRLTPTATAPAAVEDVRCALIYLTNNARKLNIDPDKIVVMGSSAGGHLALLAGLLENDHTFDTNCPTTATVRVRAIIDKYGPANLTHWKAHKSAQNWLGPKARDEAFVRSVSPLFQVKPSSPPTFIAHGDADPLVPYEQSVALHQKLLAAGVKTEFMTIAGGEHGKFPADKSKEMSAAIIRFLKAAGL